jgi:hypothetical protein
MKRILPTLGMIGSRDLWAPLVKTPEKVTKPAVVPADTAKPKVEAPDEPSL